MIRFSACPFTMTIVQHNVIDWKGVLTVKFAGALFRDAFFGIRGALQHLVGNGFTIFPNGAQLGRGRTAVRANEYFFTHAAVLFLPMRCPIAP